MNLLTFLNMVSENLEGETGSGCSLTKLALRADRWSKCSFKMSGVAVCQPLVDCWSVGPMVAVEESQLGKHIF